MLWAVTQLYLLFYFNIYYKKNDLYDEAMSLFNDNYEEISKIKNYIENLIDELDYDVGNKIVILTLEKLLENLMPYIHQSKIWLEQATMYGDSKHKFNLDFKDITFIWEVLWDTYIL